MNIPEKFTSIRQRLYVAKELSTEAQAAFQEVGTGSEKAATLLNAVAQDVFEAGLSSRRRALSGAGERSQEKLAEVVVHHEEVLGGLDVLFDVDPSLKEALDGAKMDADSLGLATNQTWLLRNAINSAQREGGQASKSTDEIETSLLGVEGELASVLESATEVSTPLWNRDRFGGSHGGGFGGGYGGGRGRRRHHHAHGSGNSWRGQRFRERWQARVDERRQKARGLDEAASRLDNPFIEIDRSADRGVRHQTDMVGYVDQALRWVDQLEQEYLVAEKQRSQPSPAPKPAPRPMPAPAPTAPIPIFETPAPAVPTPPVPQPEPVKPQPKPEGFFKRPWRS